MHVLTQVIVVNKQTVNAVIGQFRQAHQKQFLKFGVAAAQAAVAHVVLTVCTQLVAVVVTTQLNQLVHARDANTVFVLVVLGHVQSHIRVHRGWAVSHM
jgi:hypothetical protein|tara:strand:+ start:427 stop:723 length:297 start_codon:yes stop_codon:yes gene_type:complete